MPWTWGSGWRKRLVLAWTLIGMSGCAANTGVTDTFCLLYQPIYASSKDTEETQRQVDLNNGIFECRCRADCPKVSP